MLKNLFPIFNKDPNLIYLDSAATTQKPLEILDAIKDGYLNNSFPAGRSFYKEAENVYDLFLKAKKKVSENLFLNSEKKNIFFTPSVTIGLNLITNGIENYLKDGDSIAILIESHNSSIAPLIKLKDKKNINLFFFDENSIEKLSELKNLKFVFLTETTNVTGSEINYNQIKKYIKDEVFIICDAAQTFSTKNLDLNINKYDSIICSSHKMYGPYGIAPLYISNRLSLILKPNTFGGGNIEDIKIKNINNEIIKLKNFPENITFGSIFGPELYSFIKTIDWIKKNIYENSELKINYQNCMNLLKDSLINNKNIKIISNQKSKTIFSFFLKTKSSSDIAEELSKSNICVRSGFMCSHLFFNENKLPSLIRVSLGAYNNKNDILNFLKIIN